MLDNNNDNPRISGKGLIVNIVQFSELLKDAGVSVSLPSVLDVIEGLPLIDISKPDAFRCLLRANFICHKEDIATFDNLFHAYWFPKGRAKQRIPPNENGKGEDEEDTLSPHTEKMTDRGSSRDCEPTASLEWTVRYSPDSSPSIGETKKLRFAESRALSESISKLLQPLNNRISRRVQYTIRGKEISLKQILRKNMQFGGELVLLEFKKKKLKKRRVVFLCDVSGSMDIYTLLVLQFIHALKRIDHRTEIFFFSTDLSRGTHKFHEADFSTAISRMAEFVSDWGGGTRIGHCLRLFNEIHGKRLLSRKSIIMIFSDGWDRGEMDVLEAQMAFLKRKAYKIIWLNPLLGTRDYQPICQGMSTAFPYVDYFLPMGNPQDLQFLGRTLETIMV